MSRVLVASLIVGLSGCGELLLPPPGDGGCAALSAGIERPGADGGQSFAPVDGLDFPHGGTVCLDPGAAYSLRVEPHALASLEARPTEGVMALSVARAGAPLYSAQGTDEVRGWAYVGRDPLTISVRNAGSSTRMVFDFSVSLLGMAPTRVGPLALDDGGIGARAVEPTTDPALAPLLVPVTTASNPTFEFGLDRGIENVIVNGSCDVTVPFPERYVAIDLDAGTWLLSDLGVQSRDYRIRAVGSDGGTLVTGMVSQLATVTLNLTRAQRVFLSGNIADTRATCGFDGGTAPGLIGTASFSVR